MNSKEKYPKVLMIIATIVNILGTAYMSFGALMIGMIHSSSIHPIAYANASISIIVLVVYFVFLKKYSTKFKNEEMSRAKMVSFLIASPFLIGFLSMGLCIGIDYTYNEIIKKF